MIQITPGALILMAAVILMLPLQWVGAVLLSVIVHESCHAIVILLCGGEICGLTVGAGGISMETDNITGFKESICALAGPLGSLALLCLTRWMPRTAICGFVHGVYNLLPLFPMDGGRILRGILTSVFSPVTAERVLRYSQYMLSVLLAVCCCILISKAGIFLLLLGFLLLRKIHLPRSAFGSTIGVISTKGYGYDRVTQKNSAHGAKASALYRRRV